MNWIALIVGFLTGAIIGFGFGWFVFERFRARTLRAHINELTYIDSRLKTIQDKMANNNSDLTPAEVAEFISTQRYVKNDGKTKGRETEESSDH